MLINEAEVCFIQSPTTLLSMLPLSPHAVSNVKFSILWPSLIILCRQREGAPRWHSEARQSGGFDLRVCGEPNPRRLCSVRFAVRLEDPCLVLENDAKHADGCLVLLRKLRFRTGRPICFLGEANPLLQGQRFILGHL